MKEEEDDKKTGRVGGKEKDKEIEKKRTNRAGGRPRRRMYTREFRRGAGTGSPLEWEGGRVWNLSLPLSLFAFLLCIQTSWMHNA